MLNVLRPVRSSNIVRYVLPIVRKGLTERYCVEVGVSCADNATQDNGGAVTVRDSIPCTSFTLICTRSPSDEQKVEDRRDQKAN